MTTLNQRLIRHRFGATFLGTDEDGKDVFTTGQQTSLYSEQGTASVHFVLDRNARSGEAFAIFSVSGYLVDLQ